MASQRQRHADHCALHGDSPRPPGNVHRIGEPVQTIRRQHDVGGFRGRGRAARPHRDAHRGRCECRRVVDAVPHHHGPGPLCSPFGPRPPCRPGSAGRRPRRVPAQWRPRGPVRRGRRSASPGGSGRPTRRRRTVRGAFRRNGSRNNTAPASSPSTHTHAIAAESRLARFTAARAQSAVVGFGRTASRLQCDDRRQCR